MLHTIKCSRREGFIHISIHGSFCFGSLAGSLISRQFGTGHYARYLNCRHLKVPAKATKLPVKLYKGKMKSATLSGDGKSYSRQFSKVPSMFY
jgi:hypothetical protein